MNHPLLAEIDHRPWPLPAKRWIWRQTWYDLLFAHWPVAADELERHLPPGILLDRYDGQAWLGIVPFRLREIARRPLPALPGLSAFPELNVRTYVTCQGRPGVWFLSLDATHRLAIAFARRFYRLPYHRARMEVTRQRDTLHYACRRRDASASFLGHYSPVSEPRPAQPGSLEYFLTERYCLFSADARGGVLRAEIHHRPWPLTRAAAEIAENTMTRPLRIALVGEPLLHYAASVEALIWRPESV